METQTVEKPDIHSDETFHIHGMPNIEAVQHHQDDKADEYVRLKIAVWPTEIKFFFDDEKHFKAFVGEMIKAVANLK